MKINIKATNFELTEAIRSYVTEKLLAVKKVLPPQDESIMTDVEVAKVSHHHQHGGEVFKAEVNLRLAKGFLRAEAFHANLYAAVDKVRDELLRQTEDRLEKRTTLLRRGGRALKNLLRGVTKWPRRSA